MPKKAGYLSEPSQRLGPQKMGAKLRQQRTAIDWPRIERQLYALRDCYQAQFHPVSVAADYGLVTQSEKLAGIKYLDSQLQGGITCLFMLYDLVNPGIERVIARLKAQDQVLHHQAALSYTPDFIAELGDDCIKQLEKFWLPKQLTDIELGTKVQEGFNRCLEKLKEPPHAPNQVAMFKLAKRCLDTIVSEFHAAGILDVCRECGNVLYLAHARKQFSSVDYEGRNCSANRRSRRLYRRSSRKKNPSDSSFSN